MERKYAIFAVRPGIAEALVQGEKGVEFRRVRPSLDPGAVIYVYSSSPVRAIIGTFVSGDMVSGVPNSLWKRFAAVAGIPRSLFASYFDGSSCGCAITVEQPRVWQTPLSLDTIRSHIPGFRPPQSYMFMGEGDPLLALLASYPSNGAKVSRDLLPSLGALRRPLVHL